MLNDLLLHIHSHTIVCCLSKCNALNLDRNTLGKLLDGDTAASRLVGEVLLVHAVHLGKVGHVSEEDGGLFVLLAISYREVDMREHESRVRLTLITLLMLLPASSRMAFMPSQDALVLSAMLPSTSLPVLSAGI